MKIISSSEVSEIIKDNDCIATSGFAFLGVPEEILKGIETHYLAKGKPKNLTLMFAAAQGDGKEKGLNHLAHEGLVGKVIGGHFNLAPKIGEMIVNNKIKAYNIPQGVVVDLFRSSASGKKFVITRVGLNTFVDPRIEGGRANLITKDDIVKVINILGEENLLYKCQSIDVALIKASCSDEDGNISMEREGTLSEAFYIAQAAKNCGGKVIVQVDNIVKSGEIDSRKVIIPNIYVDYIVCSSEEHKYEQVLGKSYSPYICGEKKLSIDNFNPVKLDARKVIARRAALELVKGNIVNLGIGIPEIISSVAAEEGIYKDITLTVESGPIGGMPQSGSQFGSAINSSCIIDSFKQFNFYDGGGLDQAFLGLAQVDQYGNVNVSRFGERAAGCGGFINISQNTKEVIFCGTFTAGGLKIEIRDGKIIILRDGVKNKFIRDVNQITFSSEYAKCAGQKIIYITERAVFKLKKDGVHLMEYAPGINIEKDIINKMDFMPILDEKLKVMDQRIFCDEIMGLNIKKSEYNYNIVKTS